MSTMLARFEAGVDRSGGPVACWPWLGRPTKAGYGKLSRGKREEGEIYAHRLAYMLAHGLTEEDIAGLVVRHSCDNPPCCNPVHLAAGSQGENIQECVARGRHFSPGRSVTRCPKGHAYTEENTKRHGGRRQCRACSVEATRRWRSRTTEAMEGLR